jgi:hypothetical protein
MQTIEDDVRKLGINTFPIPAGLKRNEADPAGLEVRPLRHLRRLPLPGPRQVRRGHQLHPADHAPAQCDADDELPRDPALTNSSGTAVTAVEVIHSGSGKPYGSEASPSETYAPPASKDGSAATYRAGFFAVCAGAINSAVILLASANDKHPTGLANRSDQVGRNFMYHQADALLAIDTEGTRTATPRHGAPTTFTSRIQIPIIPSLSGRCSRSAAFISR